MCNAFYCRVQKSIFNNTKFAIFGDNYILAKTIAYHNTVVSSEAERGGRRWRNEMNRGLGHLSAHIG